MPSLKLPEDASSVMAIGLSASYKARMNCPICGTVILEPANLDQNLPAHACAECGGAWLSSNEYWRWLEAHGPTLPEKPYEGPDITPADNSRAKICPECGHLMLRYTVGHGTGIALDQCGGCNGIWFDRENGTS